MVGLAVVLGKDLDKKLEYLFRSFDIDRSNKIDAVELAKMIHSLTQMDQGLSQVSNALEGCFVDIRMTLSCSS